MVKKVVKTKSKKTIKAAPRAGKTTAPKIAGLSAKIFDLKGKNIGTAPLPKEIFGQKPNKNLLSQALRVYLANSKLHTAHTKTRAEVRGGGTKPWRQKGTGRARAGSIRSPLWVGGGITFGPRARDAKLSLPKKMKRKALVYALSTKAKSQDIKVIANIEKIEPKTKIIASLLKNLDIPKNSLFIVSEKNQNLKLATRNIPNVSVETHSNLNAHVVLKNNNLLLSREALAKFK